MGPLSGLQVLELGNMIAAPTAGCLLGDFGARVVKVEHPVLGDDLRRWPPTIYYPRAVCSFCLSPDYQWETLSGRGTVYSFAVVWRPNHPAFADQIPIILAVVELSEGPQMVTTLVGCDPDRAELAWT
jgi:hypothetical protein